MNDYAGQREVVAEEMGHRVYGELMRYSHDLKTERKMVISVFWFDKIISKWMSSNKLIYLFARFNELGKK